MPWYFGHPSHYLTLFSRFYSILLWQRETYGLSDAALPCVRHLLVNSSLAHFWEGMGREEAWIHRLTQAVHDSLGENTLTASNPSPNLRPVTLTWSDVLFLHPSDALLLSSQILRQNPCLLHKQRDSLLKKTSRLLILNQQDGEIVNLDQVHESLSRTTLSRNFDIAVKYLDTHPFLAQARAAYEADFIVSVHGMSLSNVAFMKPCSVVIEVFPWLYHDWRLISSLAESAGLLHFYWMEGPERTKRDFRAKELKNCPEQIKHYLGLQNHTKYLSIQDMYASDSLSSKCMQNSVCHTCTKQLGKITINLEKLKKIFLKSLAKRKECVASHPLYN